jgi:hypothetical protein
MFTCTACGSTLVLSDFAQDGSLVCRECGCLNDSASRFCQQCRQPLVAGCPMCYTLNSRSALRCKQCGVDLQRAWERQAAWSAEKQRHDQERQAALKEAAVQSRKQELQRLLVQLNEPENHPIATFCLQAIGADAVEGLIDTLLHSSDPDARYGAAHTLGLIRDGRAVPALLKALGDSEPEVRFWSAAALGSLKAEEAVPALQRLKKDPSKQVRLAAEEALEHIAPDWADKKKSWWPF